MKILIIDDDISAATTLKALLMTQDGLEIEIAHSGEKGLEMMGALAFDLLILDVMMPDFSGIDVCKAMAKDEKIKNIPVIVASALPIASQELAELLDQFKKLVQVKDIVEKPFVLSELVEKINK